MNSNRQRANTGCMPDDNGHNHIFPTRVEAQAEIDRLENSEYLLRVGELSRPSYIITC